MSMSTAAATSARSLTADSRLAWVLAMPPHPMRAKRILLTFILLRLDEKSFQQLTGRFNDGAGAPRPGEEGGPAPGFVSALFAERLVCRYVPQVVVRVADD